MCRHTDPHHSVEDLLSLTDRFSRLWRRRPRSQRAHAAALYVSILLALSAAAIVASWTAVPATGLVRTFYSTPDFSGSPLFQDRTTDVNLAFVEYNGQLPRQFFSVRWSGFWFLPRAQTVDVYASGDDRMEVLIDRRLVLTRQAGMSTTRVTLTLAGGAHEVILRYSQEGGGFAMKLLRAQTGQPPVAFRPNELFPTRPEAGDYLIATGFDWLFRVLIVGWLVGLSIPVVVLATLGVRSEWRALVPVSAREFRQRMSQLIFPALLVPLMLFLVGPHTIYGGNRGEFSVPFSSVAWPWLLVALLAGWMIQLVVGAAVCFLSARLRRAYIALLLAFGLLLWLQGTFLVADYGPLYGAALDFGRFAGRAPYEAVLWIAVALLALTFARPVSAIAPLASGLFVAVQLAGLVITIPGAQTQESPGAVWSEPPEQIYRLSRGQNVIHIVLDGFLSEILTEAVQEDRAAVDRAFSGFVFFPDHLGAFPTTRASMPAMLTGVAYRNQVPFDQFLQSTLYTRAIGTVLADAGYTIHSISFDRRDHPRVSRESAGHLAQYDIPTPYGSYRDYVEFAARQLFDLSLFRQVPQGLKPYVYNDQAWLAQSLPMAGTLRTEKAREARASNHAAFLEEFIGRLSVSLDGPVYTFLHVSIPHPPVALDADCTFIDQVVLDRASYTGQARCGLLIVEHLLDRLRALDVYDSSVVVLTSDHGWAVPRLDHPFRGLSSPAGDMEDVDLSAMPLLAVKTAGASGPLRVSYAPTAITDVAATIVGVLGLPNPFPGTSALELDPNSARPRTFAYHSWGDADWGRPYLDRLYLFSVNGHVLDSAAWAFQGTIVPGQPLQPPGP